MSLYPLAQQQAGHAAWTNMHHRASLYPTNPTEKDKERMKTFLYESMQSVALLCNNCKKHIRDYLKKNPIKPALESKEKLSLYLCNFHNSVNHEQGKEQKDCTKILRPKEEKECTDCKVEVKREDTPLDLRNTFEKFKEVSVKVFHALCDKYKIPYPTIKFHECPNSPLNSCTSMWIDSKTNDIAERPTVYLHPNIFGLRTIVHEFLHYVKQLSKDTIGAINEEGVERETQALLNKEFPFDEMEKSDLRPPIITQTQKQVVMNDHYVSALRNFPIASRIYDKHLYNVRRRDFRPPEQDAQGDWIFDMLGGVQEQGKDEGFETIESNTTSYVTREGEKYQNALSFLDGLYSPFAALFGMKASDLNRNNTPLIV
jgi:FAD-linked sulfhydryl oxidase